MTATTATRAKQAQAGGVQPLPTLPSAITDAHASKEIMRTMRRFHLGDPRAEGKVEPVDDSYLPLLLSQFRDTSKIRYDYPLYLHPPDSVNGSRPAQTLLHYLRETAEEAGASRILKDNLPWLERFLRDKTTTVEGTTEAKPLFEEGAKGLIGQLKLKEENQEQLKDDLEKLIAQVADEGRLLGYGRYTTIHLLLHVIRSRVTARREQFHQTVAEQVRKLDNLLEVERAKSAEASKPETIQESMGGADGLIDPSALSSMMGHSRGSIAMSPERQKRIQEALEVLANYRDDPILVRFVHQGKLQDPWMEKISDIESHSSDDPCETATGIFDAEVAKLAKLFAASRIAELELNGQYDRTIHDPWFANFNWEVFSRDEMLLVPAVVALEPSERIAGEGMRSLSRLLSSGRPIQVLSRVQAHNNPGALPDENPFERFRVELGYLGISHRQAIVVQSSAARPEHLLDMFGSAVDASRTSLLLVTTGLQLPDRGEVLHPWLVASAALESRAHPFFRINPDAGDICVERMDFSGNPQAEQDWPLHPCQYSDGEEMQDEELAFTFADYALLIPRLRNHYGMVPLECESDDLVSVEEYLALGTEETQEKVPFVWGVDEQNSMRRLAVSRTLIQACRDRLNYWRALQELSGVRNRYVEVAIQETRDREQATATAEIESLKETHARELDEARAEVAGEVMGRLTDALLGLDLTSVSAAPRPASAPAATPAAGPAEAAPEAAPEAVAEEEEEEISFDEPWIDTILCTSCNDCINLNPLLFVYDENKQAYIGDAKAGTYAQLVESAEFCPANCIHPGKPLNPNEPGLEELLKRAEPYN